MLKVSVLSRMSENVFARDYDLHYFFIMSLRYVNKSDFI